MLDGSAQNQEIQTYRAFALNVDSEKPASADEPELFGRGYLAADVADPDPDNKYAASDHAVFRCRDDHAAHQ